MTKIPNKIGEIRNMKSGTATLMFLIFYSMLIIFWTWNLDPPARSRRGNLKHIYGSNKMSEIEAPVGIIGKTLSSCSTTTSST